MEWWLVLFYFVASLVFLFLMGFPIAIAFFLIDFVSIFFFMGNSGLEMLNAQIFSSISTFVIAPIPLFIFMGELMFHSNLAYETIDVLDRWLGRLPGRLSLLAAVSGTLFAATSGSTMANTAMLGTVLLPEMRRRNYSVYMSVGPIIGVGGLAMLIPPSALAVVLASIAQVSVGGMLMAGVIPGVILGAMFFSYIILHAYFRPGDAPPYKTDATPFMKKIKLTVKYILPVGFIIFMVIGLIILGIATPTESAATGVIATMLVSLIFRRFNRKMVEASLKGTLEVTVMVFMIIAASKTFTAVLSFTGASNGLVNTVQNLQVHPLLILVTMQLIVGIMGCFMDPISIMLITLPVFMPIVEILKFDSLWFCVLMLINLEMGQMSPPFGMLIFVMQGVTPKDVTYEKIAIACIPYMLFDILVMALIIIWPQMALWLPGVTGQ
jgi:tripartite ATP-independent transporter DctM subunit